MRVPDEIRDCVVFIEIYKLGISMGISTGFYVNVPVGDRNLSCNYVVTAKHCLESKDGVLPDDIVIRLNSTNGERKDIHTDPNDWVRDLTSDVACLLIPVDASTHQIRVLPTSMFATQEVLDERQVGAGDEVFVTGLLVFHPGKTRNMPVVRLGCIAGMPQDPVRLSTGEDVVALVEVRSLGGLSGSPVYVHFPFWRDLPGGGSITVPPEKVTASSGGKFRLLGVMHGFYPVRQNDPENVSQGDENMNTGIAVVVLADRILRLLNREDQVAKREHLNELVEKGLMPIATGGTTTEEDSEFDRFEELARTLVNTPKPEESELRHDW